MLKQKNGEIKNFPGVDVQYEKPKSPEVTVNIAETSAQEAAKIIFDKVSKTF
ncbi:MAG: adenylyl-sulfate kinase [Melioribacteraceae bacterium]|nr:adenylyl-sulfate kinase [Melioribacteraceae bacterium]